MSVQLSSKKNPKTSHEGGWAFSHSQGSRLAALSVAMAALLSTLNPSIVYGAASVASPGTITGVLASAVGTTATTRLADATPPTTPADPTAPTVPAAPTLQPAPANPPAPTAPAAPTAPVVSTTSPTAPTATPPVPAGDALDAIAVRLNAVKADVDGQLKAKNDVTAAEYKNISSLNHSVSGLAGDPSKKIDGRTQIYQKMDRYYGKDLLRVTVAKLNLDLATKDDSNPKHVQFTTESRDAIASMIDHDADYAKGGNRIPLDENAALKIAFGPLVELSETIEQITKIRFNKTRSKTEIQTKQTVVLAHLAKCDPAAIPKADPKECTDLDKARADSGMLDSALTKIKAVEDMINAGDQILTSAPELDAKIILDNEEKQKKALAAYVRAYRGNYGKAAGSLADIDKSVESLSPPAAASGGAAAN